MAEAPAASPAAPAAATPAVSAAAPAAVAPAAAAVAPEPAVTLATTEAPAPDVAALAAKEAERVAALSPEARAAEEAAAKTKTDEAEKTRRAALTDEQRKAEDDAKVPEKYDFKVPDGVKLDAEVQTKFEAKAKALGLSQADAQELLDVGLAAVSANQGDLIAQVQNTQAEWLAASKLDPEFGGDKLEANMAIAKKAMTFATPELKAVLNNSRLGDHPEMIRWMFRVGKAMSEDGFVSGSRQAGARDDSFEGKAARIYGQTTH